MQRTDTPRTGKADEKCRALRAFMVLWPPEEVACVYLPSCLFRLPEVSN